MKECRKLEHFSGLLEAIPRDLVVFEIHEIDSSRLLENVLRSVTHGGKLLQPTTRGAVVFTRDTNQKCVLCRLEQNVAEIL